MILRKGNGNMTVQYDKTAIIMNASFFHTAFDVLDAIANTSTQFLAEGTIKGKKKYV